MRLTQHVFSNPDLDPLIEPNEPTVDQFLQDNGYNTACMANGKWQMANGKWHLGIKWKYEGRLQTK